VIADRTCSEVYEKAAAFEDNIRICSQPTSNGVTLEMVVTARSDAGELRWRTQIAVARKGGSAAAGSFGGGLRFVVKTL
jgi:hypothetical protein